MKTVKFTEMKTGTKDEYLLLDKYEQEYINNPYLENLFIWRNNLEEYLFSANSQ